VQGGDWASLCSYDFEPAVFARHPELETIRRKLEQLGARPAMMTGSGSALFGVFTTRDARDAAAKRLPGFRVSLLTREKYRKLRANVLA
jgi:4-diphosphocytidyl-2C-methyl-D-erythritol kinase